MSNMKLGYDTTGEIRRIIDGIGRTEDVKLSPDNNLFAIPEFLDNKLHIFTIQYDKKADPPRISIPGYRLIRSDHLNNPHGICFLGNDHMAVCSRGGDVSVFRVPESDKETDEFFIDPEESIKRQGLFTAGVRTPGSVDCYEVAENCYRILVCNNYRNTVTSHIVETRGTASIKNEGVLMKERLLIPDGISISPDRKWIAVSNHVYGEALIFANTPGLNGKTPPSAALKGAVCPHGIRFSPDGSRLYVADASSQYLYVYECENGNWQEDRSPARAVRMMDDETFHRGRYSTREGGIKGIDTDNSGSLLISTHKLEVLGFYDLTVLNNTDSTADSKEIAELCRQRDDSLNGAISELKASGTPRSFIRNAFRHRYLRPENYRNKLKEIISLNYLKFRNRTSSESVLDPSGPVLSLTSHSSRIETVFYTIESIGLGRQKPSRIILWLNDGERVPNPPDSLMRLTARGLEIRYCENYGPHTKYYPYLQYESEFSKPLVTADDDTIYPEYWLSGLMRAHRKDPTVIHCYSARRMTASRGHMYPFIDWEMCTDRSPSHSNFINGASGVIYPGEFLGFLKLQGEEFLRCCPKSDDIWLTVNAVRAGFKVAQVYDMPVLFDSIPGTHASEIHNYNIISGGAHTQIVDTFSDDDIAKIESRFEK